MEKNFAHITYLIHYVIICFILTNASAATITSEEIKTPCYYRHVRAKWQFYYADSHTKLSLTTKGILVGDKTWTISDWDSSTLGPVNIIARCIPTEYTQESINMFPYQSSATSVPALICSKGQNIGLEILKPNGSTADEYQYVGTLTREQEDEEKQEISANSSLSVSDHSSSTAFPMISDSSSSCSCSSSVLATGNSPS